MQDRPPLITLTSDFAVQSQGVGAMEAVIYSIAPNARVVHLMHGLPKFDVLAAARTMETVRFLPVGYHVCVCDPGVGTSRKALAIQTQRGDYFVGPDNGVFGPATRLLGGAICVHELVSSELMRQPVSPIFHGRDIFAPAAAHLACGIRIEDFGPALDPDSLVASPYSEATLEGTSLHATIIQINRYGSIHLNILHEQWDSLGLKPGRKLTLLLPNERSLELPIGETFSDVPKGESLIMKDDYGRAEIARNLGSFISEFPLEIGDQVKIRLL
jgi:S-adenosyl-L-methionine hydrolase (adenosine-forming)